MVQKLRKKMLFDAVQSKGDNYIEVFAFLQQDILSPITGGGLFISMSELSERVDPGDWIIRDEEGEFTVCKADDFPKKYELV